MRLIVFTGLVSIEKARITRSTAMQLLKEGQSVAVIDATDQIEVAAPDDAGVQRISGNDLTIEHIAAAIDASHVDVVLFNAPESMPPDALLTILDGVEARLAPLEVRWVSVIDDRMCDCFPHLREILEDYADVSLRPPFDVEKVLV